MSEIEKAREALFSKLGSGPVTFGQLLDALEVLIRAVIAEERKKARFGQSYKVNLTEEYHEPVYRADGFLVPCRVTSGGNPQPEGYRAGLLRAAEIADEAERQQEIDHSLANTGGAGKAAAAIREEADKGGEGRQSKSAIPPSLVLRRAVHDAGDQQPVHGEAKSLSQAWLIITHPAFRIGFCDAQHGRPFASDRIFLRIWTETPDGALRRLGITAFATPSDIEVAQYRYEEGRLAVLQLGLRCKAWGHPDFPPASLRRYVETFVASKTVAPDPSKEA